MLSEFQRQLIGYCKFCKCPIYCNEDEGKYMYTSNHCFCELEEDKLDTNVLNQRIKELEEEIETHVKSIEIWKEEYHKTDSKVTELESDLKLNASMLAKQTDLAREAETSFAKLKEAIKKNEDYTRSHYQVVSLEDEELYAVLRRPLE